MAGMLPGVGVGPRRRTISTRLDHLSSCEYLRDRREPPLTAASSMEETALRARQRLEQKLGNLHSSARSGKNQSRRERSNNKEVGGKAGSGLLGRTWNFGFKRYKSDGMVCAVCLDSFTGDKQPVMDLSCSHKYHSDCLLPWITTNPNCPCCRTPIPSDSSVIRCA